MNDWQLLENYSRRGSEAAFKELVERYMNLVYSAAMRRVGESELAKEISQTVFILLARKAATLRETVILSAWLFRTTRFVAAHAIRTMSRRQKREQEAIEMQTLSSS